MNCIKDELISEIVRTEEKIRKNEMMFNMTEDDDLLESLIYEEKALQARYRHLIKTAKQNGISISFLER